MLTFCTKPIPPFDNPQSSFRQPAGGRLQVLLTRRSPLFWGKVGPLVRRLHQMLGTCTLYVYSVYCFMILNFRDQATEDLYNGTDSKAARSIPRNVWKVAARKLDMINAAHLLSDLKVPPGNRMEPLKGKWKGYHSIRINDQYRIVFSWAEGNAKDVGIVDYH